MGKLQDRFVHLWQRHAIVENPGIAVEVFNRLSEMYGESWRSYHNLNHIRDCLNYFDACNNHALFPDSIEFAIWFHDCIYEVGAQDNEERSRDWFLEKSEGCLNSRLRTIVAKLIMDTSLNGVPDSKDGKLLADIDLTSFGLPWHKYIKDSTDVQHELMANNITGSDAGKRKFLTSLMEKENIYYSMYYRKYFEQTAQINIQKHLQQLSA